MQTLKTPLEMFYRWEAEVPGVVFLRQSLGAEGWLELTWAQFADRVRRVASFLSQQTLQPQSNIGIWSSNSIDWPIVDFAIQLAGHVSVPLYPGQDSQSARYILEHADVQLLFVGEMDAPAEVVAQVVGDISTIGMRGSAHNTRYSLENIIGTVEPFSESPIPRGDALLTIVYSSGTTGRPKGVMLAHETPAYGAALFSQWLPEAGAEFAGDRGRLFSFLPMAHVAERIAVEMTGLYRNASISFSAGLESFASELASVEPTVFFAVPRLWAKFKAGVDAQIPPEVQVGFGDAERQAIRQKLGLDKALCVLSASAPLSQDLAQWYFDMGIRLREAYGSSETCGIGTFTQSDTDFVLGAVGSPAPDVQLKISEEGEIFIKTKALMKGYYKDEAKTSEAIVDGWYRSGDRGYVGDDGLLRVTGRMGEVFKTTKGKFVHPAKLENAFASIAELGQLLVFGHGEDQPLLLANLSMFGQEKEQEVVRRLLEESLNKICVEIPAHEKVAQIFVTKAEWTIESGLLTPTMKIKRGPVVEHYRDWVQGQLGTGPVVFEQ